MTDIFFKLYHIINIYTFYFFISLPKMAGIFLFEKTEAKMSFSLNETLYCEKPYYLFLLF